VFFLVYIICTLVHPLACNEIRLKIKNKQKQNKTKLSDILEFPFSKIQVHDCNGQFFRQTRQPKKTEAGADNMSHKTTK
jgi:hypothetical protein